MSFISKKYIFIIFFIASFFIVADFALAQGANTLLWGNQAGNVQTGTGLGDEDPRVIIARIINVLLGFLGVVAVLIILYGGWIWMTSQGNPQQIDKAKKILISAVIGLIIVLMSFAIAQFVINSLYSATAGCNPGDWKNCGCGDMGTQVCNASGSWDPCVGGSCLIGENCCSGGFCAADCSSPPSFVITSTSPADGTVNLPMNTKIRYKFNLPINAGTVSLGAGGTFHVEDGSGVDIPGNLSPISGNLIEYVPSGVCPANPCGATGCLPAGETVTVTADTGIISVGGNALVCTILNPCVITFTVSSVVDCEKPKVSLDFDQICAVANNELYANTSDDSGVWQVEFFVNSAPVPNAPAGNNPIINPFPAPGDFNTRSLFMPSYFDATTFSAGDTIQLKAVAYDVDANTSSDTKNVTLRPDHCCNGVLDGDEEAIDCGGSCAACNGAACGVSMSDACVAGDCSANNNICASDFCDCTNAVGTECQDAGYDAGINNCCLCQEAPVIDWITPLGGFCDGVGGGNTACTKENESTNCAAFGGVCNLTVANGASGNLITIGGRWFGAVPGVVQIGGVNAILASVVNPACINSWSNNEIIVEVPGGLSGDQVVMVENIGGLQDESNDARGPSVDFFVNTIVRPGLCGIAPSDGKMGDAINYSGIRLNNNSAFFGNSISSVAALSSVFVGNTLGVGVVPNITDGKTTTFTRGPAPNFVSSNYLSFKKLSDDKGGPRIISFEPVTGNEGQYVTIIGEGFGSSQGSSNVRFDADSANFNFPEICSDNLWSDTQIIVKVPPLINGNYTIFIDLASGPTIDTSFLSPNTFIFNDTLALSPSLCKIDPIMGPNNSSVKLFGEYFDSYNNPISKVRFNFNKDQFGPALPLPAGPIQSWGAVGDHDEIDVLVHPLAVSGPVRVVKNNPEVVGNGLNFKIGFCNKEIDPDAACGAGNICCPTGSYKEGQCLADLNDCYLEFQSSVFEWDFSTEVDGSGIGVPCDSDLVAPGCQPSAICAFPLECSLTSCTCQPSSGESCSGLSLDKCLLTEFCPNSPGQCSTYPGGQPKIVGSCDHDCEGVGLCTAATCDYNSVTDRCELIGSVCDMTMPAVDILGNAVTAYCTEYNGAGHWHINTNMSCPIGWTNIFGGRCVDLLSACNICSSGFKCVGGSCAADLDICPAGSLCNVSDECETTDDTKCECCCEIGQDERDCCSPLTCEGACGEGSVDADKDGVDDVFFGECSGCTTYDGFGNIDQALSDAACNCSGHIGKFCETTDPDYPDGVCRDCASLTSDAECQVHDTTCCLDAMNGGVCRGGDGTILMGSECAYYDCVATGDSCNTNPINSGEFRDIPTCDIKCVPGTTSGLGLSCASTSTDPTQSNVCNTTICANPFECLNPGGGGATPPDNCGFCCCDPNDVPDPCPGILECNEAEPCDGGGRGLCCGCSEDIDCDNISAVGCGRDACCRARPSVVSVEPVDELPSLPGTGTICRNALISAEFNEPMDGSSFSGNMIVVADYGASPCPAGTEYLISKKSNDGIFNFLVSRIGSFLVDFLPGNYAHAYTNPSALSHYCAITGAVSSDKTPAGNGIIRFSPLKLLPADKLHYAIIKGDEDLNSSKGVLNKWGIGMNGPMDINNIFNSVEYENSYIWSFRTLSDKASNDGVCLLGSVELEPYSYLFKTNLNSDGENDLSPLDPTFDTVADRDKVFTAIAKSYSGQSIVPIAGVYDWDWGWSLTDPSVANCAGANCALSTPFLPAENNKRLILADPGKTEGKTILISTAVINTGLLPDSPSGTTFSDDSDIYLFVCENPWPPIIGGIWKPWRDADYSAQTDCIPGSGICNNMNYEIYYCRDKGSVGTYDDLPSIASDPVLRGDANPSVLKEAYFLRDEAPADTTVLSVTDPGLGGVLDISWAPPVAGASGYKIYWGKSSNSYDDYIDVGNVLSYTLSDLDNDKKYYINITAYKDGAESEYHGEVFAIPTDSTSPAPPVGVAALAGVGSIDISWDKDLTGDVKSYKLYYGVSSGDYGGSLDVGFEDNVTVDGLIAGEDYYFTVTALDEYDNESAYSVEVSEIVL